MLKKSFILSIFLLFPAANNASICPSQSLNYQVCFTPGGNCPQDIVDTLNSAKKQVLVQAYQLTSAPIAWALVEAHRRGVDVKVILDKSQKKGKRGQPYSPAKFLENQGIQVWIDYKPAIAHNKVIIIDDEAVITGSFNFSKAAQMRNAENLLILKDANLAKVYAQNWKSRQAVSEKFGGQG